MKNEITHSTFDNLGFHWTVSPEPPLSQGKSNGVHQVNEVSSKLCILIISFSDQGWSAGAPPEPRQSGPRPQHPLQPEDECLHRQQEAGDTDSRPQQGDY